MPCPPLPPELLDHVVDFLHDSSDALQSCCLVLKSWIPHTRKHIFANIDFQFVEDLQSWKTVFPDPSTSPARYAKTMFTGCPRVLTALAAKEGCWVSAFSRVVDLKMNIVGRIGENKAISLVPFHRFSPVLKCLDILYSDIPPSKIFKFICSFPLLEDVLLRTLDHSLTERDHSLTERPIIVQPSSSPVFSGTLTVRHGAEIGPIASRLLSLPGGLRFRRLCLLFCCKADISITTVLVEKCSCTLEFIYVDSRSFGTSVLHLCPH